MVATTRAFEKLCRDYSDEVKVIKAVRMVPKPPKIQNENQSHRSNGVSDSPLPSDRRLIP